MVKLALMCKSHNYELLGGTTAPAGKTIRVGDWVISKARRQELINSVVVLTETQSSPAYMGGRIVEFIPLSNGKCQVVFDEDKALVGNKEATGHRGWGCGRGVCYV
jgi:hypothetical protein